MEQAVEAKKVSLKPELKYHEGKLIAKASVGVDTDGDGIHAVAASVSVEIDAKEAVNEIIKDGAPQWLKDLLTPKA
jgi:hypothetical protein